MPEDRKDTFRFDVAFSFSGEHRDVVRAIAAALKDELGPRIFYDEWYEAELAGHNADLILQQVFQDSRLIVVCQDQSYAEKPWVQFEWNAIRSLILQRRSEADSDLRILPIRLGREPVPSFFADTGFIDARDRPPEQIASLIVERLKILKAEEAASSAISKPTPEKQAVIEAEDKKQEVFISYSWKHDADIPMVDDLCASLESNGINVVRDKTHIETGDRISQFMDRLGKGGCVVVILSDAYLKSQYCMYELYRLFAMARLDDERFLNCVIPLIHDGIEIGKPIARIKYAAHWKRERDELDAAAREFGPDVMGHEDHKALRRMSEFALFVSDMLAYLNDKCIPRRIEDVRAENFQLVCRLVRDALKR